MNLDDLLISDPIRKVIKMNPIQNNEPDMEETKEGGDTISSESEEQVSEQQQAIINESLESFSISSEMLLANYNLFRQRNRLIISSSSSDSSNLSSSSSSDSESEEEEERKENLSISISE